MVPVCVSNLHGKIDINRWDNGELLVEFLQPLPIANYRKETLRELSKHSHQLMAEKIAALDAQLEGEQPEHKQKEDS